MRHWHKGRGAAFIDGFVTSNYSLNVLSFKKMFSPVNLQIKKFVLKGSMFMSPEYLFSESMY